MGVGNYTEKDVRECARAFTGWYFDDLAFKVDPAKHDDGAKTFLGRTGNFDGVEVLKIIFEQPVTAEFLAGEDLPLPGPRRAVAGSADAAGQRSSGTTTTRSSRC